MILAKMFDDLKTCWNEKKEKRARFLLIFLICALSIERSGVCDQHFLITVKESPSKIVLRLLISNPNFTASWHVRASASKADPTPLWRTDFAIRTRPDAFRATRPEPERSVSFSYDASKFILRLPSEGGAHRPHFIAFEDYLCSKLSSSDR